MPEIIEAVECQREPRPRPSANYAGCARGCALSGLLAFNLLPLALALVAMLVAYELAPFYSLLFKGAPLPPLAATFFGTANYLWIGGILLLLFTTLSFRCKTKLLALMAIDLALTALLSAFIVIFTLVGILQPLIVNIMKMCPGS